MDQETGFDTLWTWDQPFYDPVELADFIWLPENDGPELARARLVVEIGRKCLRTGFRVPVDAFLRAIAQVLTRTHGWLMTLPRVELYQYVLRVCCVVVGH